MTCSGRCHPTHTTHSSEWCWCPPPDPVITSFSQSSRRPHNTQRERFYSYQRIAFHPLPSPSSEKSHGDTTGTCTPARTHRHRRSSSRLPFHSLQPRGLCQFPYGVRQQIVQIAQLTWDRHTTLFQSHTRQTRRIVARMSKRTRHSTYWASLISILRT